MIASAVAGRLRFPFMTTISMFIEVECHIIHGKFNFRFILPPRHKSALFLTGRLEPFRHNECRSRQSFSCFRPLEGLTLFM